MSDVFAYLDPEPSPGSMAHPEAVWAQAKEDYLGGDSAGVVCQRYSLSRSRFFERAKAQGWRRRDREREAADDRAAYDAEADAAFVCAAMEAPAAPAYVLARRAWAMAERAILMRRRTEAAGWVRVVRDLRRLAMEEAGALTWERTVKRSEPPRPAEPPAPAAPAATEAAEPSPAPPPPRPPMRGPIPDCALTSERKLALWLEQEFGPGVRALGLPGLRKASPDSPDQSRRTTDSGGADVAAAQDDAAPDGSPPPCRGVVPPETAGVAPSAPASAGQAPHPGGRERLEDEGARAGGR